MIEEQARTRRWFLSRVAPVGAGTLGISASLSEASRTGEAGSTRGAGAKERRLDSHVHVPDSRAIERLHDYVAGDRLTHYAALVDNLSLIEELKARVGARCIPFHRLRKPLEHPIDSLSENSVAGYKLHLRHPMTTDGKGETVAATEKHLGKICEEAGRLGRPVLFHSDADEPDICSLPLLAELARRHPQTKIIAAHWGMYTQEYQAAKNTPQEWERKLRPLVPQNVRLLLEIKNLYADVALLGRDFPERSADHDFKLKLLVAEVEALKPAQRKILLGKLFIGTDFPAFRDTGDPRIGYLYQRDCMRRLFKEELEEDRMTSNFLSLLPAEFRR